MIKYISLQEPKNRQECLNRLRGLGDWISTTLLDLFEIDDEFLTSFIINVIEEKVTSPLTDEQKITYSEINTILEPFIRNEEERLTFIKSLSSQIILSLQRDQEFFYEDRNIHHHHHHNRHRHPSPPPSPPRWSP